MKIPHKPRGKMEFENVDFEAGATDSEDLDGLDEFDSMESRL